MRYKSQDVIRVRQQQEQRQYWHPVICQRKLLRGQIALHLSTWQCPLQATSQPGRLPLWQSRLQTLAVAPHLHDGDIVADHSRFTNDNPAGMVDEHTRAKVSPRVDVDSKHLQAACDTGLM
jgi:hypothetical protein